MNIVNTIDAYDLAVLPYVSGRWYRVGSSLSTYSFYRDTLDARNNPARMQIPVKVVPTDAVRLSCTDDGYYYVASRNVIGLLSNGTWTAVTDSYASEPAAVMYSADGTRTDVTDVIDNNGLLKDGSVVIRDSNRIIRAILSVDSEGDIQIKPCMSGGLKLYDNTGGYIHLKDGAVTYKNLSK